MKFFLISINTAVQSSFFYSVSDVYSNLFFYNDLQSKFTVHLLRQHIKKLYYPVGDTREVKRETYNKNINYARACEEQKFKTFLEKFDFFEAK